MLSNLHLILKLGQRAIDNQLDIGSGGPGVSHATNLQTHQRRFLELLTVGMMSLQTFLAKYELDG